MQNHQEENKIPLDNQRQPKRNSNSQLFYSDLSINNGYIPAAGVGMANKEFQGVKMQESQQETSGLNKASRSINSHSD